MLSNFFFSSSIFCNSFFLLSIILILYCSANFLSISFFFSFSSSTEEYKLSSLKILFKFKLFSSLIIFSLIILFSFNSSPFIFSCFSRSLTGSWYCLFISSKNFDNLGINLIIALVCLNPILKIIGSKFTFITITDFSLWGSNKNEWILVWKRKPWIILSHILSMEYWPFLKFAILNSVSKHFKDNFILLDW